MMSAWYVIALPSLTDVTGNGRTSASIGVNSTGVSKRSPVRERSLASTVYVSPYENILWNYIVYHGIPWYFVILHGITW